MTQVDKGPSLVNISIVLIQSSLRLSSSLVTLGVLSLKLAFGPALFTRQMDRKGVISSPPGEGVL